MGNYKIAAGNEDAGKDESEGYIAQADTGPGRLCDWLLGAASTGGRGIKPQQVHTLPQVS